MIYTANFGKAGDAMGDRDGIQPRFVYEDGQHRRLSRLFAISCILSLILILSLIGFSFHAIFTHIMLNEAEDDAVKFGRALLEHEIEQLIRSGSEGGTTIAMDEAKFPFFDQRVQRSLQFLDVAKVKIYSNDRKIVYSTDYTIIGQTDRTNTYLEQALSGRIVSELQSGSEVWDLGDEQRFAADMVETYIPVRDRNDNVLGAFEIYMAVASYHEKIRNVLTASLVVFFCILIGVFGNLLYFMRRASKTIYSKSREIRSLSGLLPICSFCKKIRNQQGEWESIEEYITARSESEFSHSICPECKEKHYSDM